jgi:FlaA1/EpsC-like NDP-sugar epimerase
MLQIVDRLMSKHYISAWLIALIDVVIVIDAIFILGTILGIKQLIIINFFVTYILLILFRMFVRWLFEKAYESGINTELNTQALIFGAGRTATAMANTLISASRKYYIKGFVDDDPNLAGKTIMGHSIWRSDELETSLKYKDIDSLIIATNCTTLERKNEIFEICHQNRIKVSVVPHIRTWNDSKLQENQIREVQIEELLTTKEDCLPTYHKKIFIAQTEETNHQQVETSVMELILLLQNRTSIEQIEEAIVRNIKKLVQTFKSNNSRFEELNQN